MHLDLSPEETEVFRSLLHDYLPELRREVARTDARDFRHALVKRQDLCERLLADLDAEAHDGALRSERGRAD